MPSRLSRPTVRLFLLSVLLIGAASCAHQPAASDPSQKEANIKKLIELENITGQIRQLSDDDLRRNTVKTLSNNPNLSQEDVQILSAILLDAIWEDIAQYVDQSLAPLYSSRFSDQEVIDLIAFYGTETGKKYADTNLILKINSLDLAMKTMKDWSEKSQTQAYHNAMLRKIMGKVPESMRTRIGNDALLPNP